MSEEAGEDDGAGSPRRYQRDRVRAHFPSEDISQRSEVTISLPVPVSLGWPLQDPTRQGAGRSERDQLDSSNYLAFSAEI